MADGYLENKMAEYRAGQPRKVYKPMMSLAQLLRKNRSHRAYDAKTRVRDDQLRKIISACTLVPSARNQQVLRLRPVLADEASKVLPLIHLGGALPQLHLPVAGSEPTAYIVVCATVEESRYVDIDLGIAAQSMLLQAVELGLNGICIGAFDRAKLREVLALPYEPLLVLAIGRGTEKIVLTPIGAAEDHAYYRKEGVHYVPKVRVDDLIL